VVGAVVPGPVVGNAGSASVPQPGQIATPSVVVLHPAVRAVSKQAAASATLRPIPRPIPRPVPSPWEMRTQQEYAPSDWSDVSDSRRIYWTVTFAVNVQVSFSPPSHGRP
jgi:hypothetical protein